MYAFIYSYRPVDSGSFEASMRSACERQLAVEQSTQVPTFGLEYLANSFDYEI